MLIYSIVPPEYIVEQPTQPKSELVSIAGGYLQGVRSPDGLVVQRVISTNPSDYLKPAFSPGSVYRSSNKKRHS